MYRRIIPVVISILFLAACNSKPGEKDTQKDSTDTDHGHAHAPVTGGVVPPLPAIPEGAKVFFRNLNDGAVLASPLKIEMGADGIRVDTAGPVIAGIGHHHLLINAGDSVPAGRMIPNDSAHIHFGRGQTETEVTLAPGTYRLALQMADGLHRSYGSALSTAISITVK